MPPPFDDPLRLPRPELVLGYPSGVPGIDHAHEDETRVDSAICQHSRRADELTDPLSQSSRAANITTGVPVGSGDAEKRDRSTPAPGIISAGV